MARAPTKVTPQPFAGGLNLVAPTFQLEPGEAKVLHNYTVNDLGRYERVKGFLRFDGRKDPLSYPFTVVEMTEPQEYSPTPPEVGDMVEGLQSAATGTVIHYHDKELVLLSVSGRFERGEELNGAHGNVVRTAENMSLGHVSNTQQYRKIVVEHFMHAIQPVPGSGPIRGLSVFHNEVLAWRDNEAGDETVLWRSGPSGWHQVNVVPPRDYFAPFPYQYLIYSGQAGQLRYDIDALDEFTHRQLEAFRRGYFTRASLWS